jgi:hypothetical protein
MKKKISVIFNLSRFQAGALGVWLVFKLLGSVNSPKPLYSVADAIIVGFVLYLVMVAFNLIIWFQDRNDPPDYNGY